MKKLVSLLLAFVMVMSIFAVVPIEASAAGAVKMKHYMTYSMKQGDYSDFMLNGKNQGCCAMSYAIGLSIVTGNSIEPTQFWYNNTTNYTKGKVGGYISYNSSNYAAPLYQAVYSGKPVMLHYKYGTNSQHWVIVIGAKDNSLSASSFICIDPVYGTERTLNNCWSFGNVSGMKVFTETAKSFDKDETHTHSYDTYLPDCPDCQVYAPNQNLGTIFYSTITNAYLGTAVTGVDGNDIKSYALNGSLKQWWKFENCGNNEYEITNCYYGKCLDVYCALNANNTNVDLYVDNNTSAQRWYIKSSKNGYILVPKCAPTLSMDVEATSGNDGANIQIYKCSANNAQVFTIPFRLNGQPCDLGDAFDSKIVNIASGKALTNKNGQLLMYGVDGSYSQAWRFVKDAEGAYQIFSYKNWGKCIDVYTGLSANHTAVQLYDYNTTNAQKWFVIKEDYRYRLVPRCSTSRTLDVVDGSSLDGASLQIYDYHKNNAQYFALDPNSLPFDILDYGDSFTSKIINEGTQKLVVGTSTGNVEIGTDNGTNEFVWRFDKNEDGSYRVTNLEYDKCLDVDCGSQYNHTNIGIYAGNETDAQKWYLVPVGDSVVFVPACALMRAMDVKDNSSVDGTNIELYTYWESSAQKYRFEMVKEEPKMLIGDVNGDGNINIMDATEIQRHIAQLSTIPEDRLSCADANKDGQVNIMDATQIQRFIAQLIPSL